MSEPAPRSSTSTQGSPASAAGPVDADRLVREHGAPRDGEPQSSDRRLYMRLTPLRGAVSWQAAAERLHRFSSRLESVLYVDAHDPGGIAVLTIHEDPAGLVEVGREALGDGPFASMRIDVARIMIGRTYAIGYEPDLDETLLHRPRRTAMQADWPWAIWYPLRRAGSFEQLGVEEQRGVLREHGVIGRAFAEKDLAHDIRLACHGLDRADNDFVVGLVGAELAPLSALVQRMRKTQQTSRYLERLGPFFVGRAVWRSGDPQPS